MLLQDFFDQLTYGELAQVSIGGIEQEGVVDEVIPNVVSHINLGLLKLSKRFSLKTETITLQEYDTINTYKLHTDYAVTDGGVEPIRYIEDSAEYPFKNNVIKIEYIEDVTDSENITEVPFNVLSDAESIRSRDYRTFYVPDVTSPRTLNVTYRAEPDALDPDTTTPETDEIAISPVLTEALLYFVASRIHANRPTIDGQENTSLKYMQMYEAEVAGIDNEDLLAEADFDNTKLDDNGWL